MSIPIFVITLLENEERKKHVETNILDKHPSSVIFPAVDNKSEEFQIALRDKEIKVQSVYGKKTLRGKIACSLSHLRLWRHLVDKNIDKAIVFEDDVETLEDFDSVVRQDLPDDLNFLFLYVHPRHFCPSKNVVNAYFSSYYYTWCRSAYLITNAGCKKLIEHFENGLYDNGDNMVNDAAKRGIITAYMVRSKIVDNIGQSCDRYKGEKLKSTIWNTKLFRHK